MSSYEVKLCDSFKDMVFVTFNIKYRIKCYGKNLLVPYIYLSILWE